MPDLNIVQFVYFETTLDTDQFIQRWQEYRRSDNVDFDITLQRCEEAGIYRYLAQHRHTEGELRFIFSKGAASPRVRRAIITTKQVGGYSVLQSENGNESRGNETKLFVFLATPQVDLNHYRQLPVAVKLNIYEAYYENCRYAYILEYFVKNKDASLLREEIKKLNPAEIGVYKECSVQPA